MRLYVYDLVSVTILIVASYLHIHRVERSCKAVSDLIHLLLECQMLLLLVVSLFIFFDNIRLIF